MPEPFRRLYRRLVRVRLSDEQFRQLAGEATRNELTISATARSLLVSGLLGAAAENGSRGDSSLAALVAAEQALLLLETMLPEGSAALSWSAGRRCPCSERAPPGARPGQRRARPVSERCIVAVKFTPAGGGAARLAAGFMRYIQYRDRHRDSRPAEPRPTGDVERLLKYVAHRDRSSARALLFDAGGITGDEGRRRLSHFVRRALHDPIAAAPGTRALYRFVISPERAAGLDLVALTRAAVAELETSAGGSLRWMAAEHRNTAHPHVHLVVAGLREPDPGRFVPVALERQQLKAIKGAVANEIARQRQVERPSRLDVPADVDVEGLRVGRRRRPKAASSAPPLRWRLLIRRAPRLPRVRRLAARYRWDLEREVEQARARQDRERSR